MRIWRMRTLSLAALGLVLSFPAPAGCISDCRDEYDSELSNCRIMYDDPDDADDLQLCVDNAKAQYQDCIEECRS